MTGSEICKANRRPSVQQQPRGGETCKVELLPTNQLRRLAIKNSYGNKSLPSSPLGSRSVSTTSLDQISSTSPTPTNTPSKSTESLVSVDDSATPTSTTPLLCTAADKLTMTCSSLDMQQPGRQGGGSAGTGPKASPYITRQELLHSLRRTCSNFSMTQSTMCSGNSSYIHHTPRHLARTNFNNPKKPPLSRSAATTPDSFLGRPGEKEDLDLMDADETRSMVEMTTSARPMLMSPPRRSGSRANSSVAQQYRRMELLAPPTKSAIPVRQSAIPVRQRGGTMKLQAYENRSIRTNSLARNITQNGVDSGKRNFEDSMSVASGSSSCQTSPIHQTSPQHSPPHSGLTPLHNGLNGNNYNLVALRQQATPTHPTLKGAYSINTSSPFRKTTGARAVSTRPTPMATALATDKKIRLHIPQGRKTASLV